MENLTHICVCITDNKRISLIWNGFLVEFDLWEVRSDQALKSASTATSPWSSLLESNLHTVNELISKASHDKLNLWTKEAIKFNFILSYEDEAVLSIQKLAFRIISVFGHH